MNKHKRHGDVILHPVNKLEGKEIKHDGKFVLALGTATGHSHQILCSPEIMKITNNGKRNFIGLNQEAKLVHQQHKPIKLNKKYAQVQEREKDHFSGATRIVVD